MGLIRVNVIGLAELPQQEGRTVFLREEGGERRILPMLVGPAEAYAIGLELAGEPFQRPLSHDLLMSITKAFNSSLERIAIVRLKGNTFYAELSLRTHDKNLHVIDARPSDSIVLALKAGVDIFVDEGVMDQAGVQQEQPVVDAIIFPASASDEAPIDPDPSEVRKAVESLTSSVSPGPQAQGDRADELRREMESAVAAEDFERAAQVRDQLRALERS